MIKTQESEYQEQILKTYIYLLHAARGIYNYSTKSMFSKNNMNLPKFIILRSIYQNGGKITNSKVAEWSATKRSNITDLVKSLLKEKFVEIESDLIDGRVKYIKLTTKGKKLLKEALVTESQTAGTVMKGITLKQAEQINRFLDKMLGNINLHDTDSRFGKKN